MNCDWVPHKAVGEFVIGSPIRQYVQDYSLQLLVEECGQDEWDVYGIPDKDIRIAVEDGLITSIGCFDECRFKGRNLIGMLLEDVIEFLGERPEEDVDSFDLSDGPEDVYEFDKLDAQVWIRKGKVVAIYIG